MNKLMKYLKNIPEHEKHDIHIYYAEMFDEAGIMGSDDVPKSFGDPKNIALEVLTDIKTYDDESSVHREDKNNRNVLLIIILAIIAAPIGIPLAIALAATIGALFITFIAVGASILTAMVVSLLSVFMQDITIFSRIYYLGIFMALVGLSILFFEFFRFIIKKISYAISKKLRERRAKNEKEY